MRRIFALLWTLLLALPAPAWAISITSFGPQGEGGTVHGQTFTIGTGGVVHEFDAFFFIAGQDLNGTAPGTAARLSVDALPIGLAYIFSASLSPDAADLSLKYSFSNTTGVALDGLRFLVFLDAEIDGSTNTFFNEYGEMIGVAGPGVSWEIDEPGFVFGDIVDHLLAGTLDNANSLPDPRTMSRWRSGSISATLLPLERQPSICSFRKPHARQVPSPCSSEIRIPARPL